MRKLFAILLMVALPLAANEQSHRSLQTGSPTGGTPLYDRGLRGENQIVAVLDTGLDWSSCYFAEPDATPPPFNTGSPAGGFAWQNVDLSRRKVVAYNFLYSCAQFPGARGCDDPTLAGAFDNQGHGTVAAGMIAADKGAPGQHDFGDAIAPMARLVIQDAGFIGGDNCSQRPGIGCPVRMIPILEQAWRQGARIHSNSWGDRQGVSPFSAPPTANYSTSARDVDAFVHAHPDMLVVFNTGNYGVVGLPPASSLSAPGSAKNTLQVGGTRVNGPSYGDNTMPFWSLVGPTRDGRIKPDLVGPAVVTGPQPGACAVTQGEAGTSWASPTIAGAAALVRQYYTDGFYPTGAANEANRMNPSAALLKATLIASAQQVPYRWDGTRRLTAAPVPSFEQGFGFPALDNALYFSGDTGKLRVVDTATGLAAGESASMQLTVRPGTPLKAVLVWTDPPGTPSTGSFPQLVNDLDLRISGPGGTRYGNGHAPDRLNNVEMVNVADVSAGTYTITVEAHTIAQGPRQSYALVITGDFSALGGRSRAVRH
ncbi:MAG TPA: S8 family serine peptidase [Thermoanaerobaculia bacterium]